MSQPLGDRLLEFIAALRADGVRISVAESLDAMHAVAAAGLARVRLREALRASLIKDEADNLSFESLFAGYFEASGQRPGSPLNSRGAKTGVTGSGGGRAEGATSVKPNTSHEPPLTQSGKPSPSRHDGKASDGAMRDSEERSDHGREGESAASHERREQSHAAASSDTHDGEASRHAGLRTLERTPFARYSDLEYATAREILAILQRRLRVSLGRRMRFARRGRLDFRRTIRAATQRGGALIDLRFRARRPRHIDLLILADVSGSVHYASTLMLELIAGARQCFRRMRAFVFIDHLATADFERGHLVMTPALDLYARSDFGRVFAELRDHHGALLTSATVLVIMGDGRNNRRAARTDLLRDIAGRCRSTIWLNPEAPERWGTGDSAIDSYRKAVDLLLPSGNLRELEAGLARIV
ncbi:MAG TPA: VWA domain-containing protein [Candidatus Binataceae bacterium]|nr:VWA domain-containing protein [Candidatus Binataceae bacterium]